MKIIYNENPMLTTIELDDKEKEILWLKIKVDYLRDSLLSAHFSLEEGEFFNLDRARNEVNVDWMGDDEKEGKSRCDVLIDKIFEEHMRDLSGPHIGDCICVPCSCGKCYAESLLEIDTIKGLRKHPGHHVDSSFDKGKRSIHEAITYLEHHKPKASWKGWEDHVPRWEAEQKEALEWLKAYRDQHFPISTS